MNLPVYILIRTSGRPKFFGRMMETIKSQTYDNIVTIVHTDDPRDEYVTGDIILKGAAYGQEYGSAPYNLYNNKLLKAIPSEGWFHFIDDDDEYANIDVIEKLVKRSKKDYVNVGRVERWNKTLWPKNWGYQKSFQTECFFMHTDYRFKSKWWGNKGGDHYYSKQLTKILPINWMDKLLICKAQEGKGHGRKLDKGGKIVKHINIDPESKIPVLGLRKNMSGPRAEWIKRSEMKYMRYETALRLEKLGKVKITNYTNYQEPPGIRNMLEI
jgi:hypothetical protein